MFGTYQNSDLRIELNANAVQIRESLTNPSQLKKWLWPQRLDIANNSASAFLCEGQSFSSQLGLVKVTHQVEMLSPMGIRFLLSGGIDGFHEWQWGDGWVQSRLEGVSLLPLSLGQTLSLLRLKQYVLSQSKENTPTLS